MNLLTAPRVRRWVRGGPARLSSWLVVPVSPAGIVAAAGTLAVRLNGAEAWVNINGVTAWLKLANWTGDLAAHIAATGTAVHGLGTASTLTAAAANGAATLGADGLVLPAQLNLVPLQRTGYSVGSYTHTPLAATRQMWVEIMGAGGGGAGAAKGSAGQCCAGGGGAAGSYAARLIPYTGGTLAIVVGAGGAGGLGSTPGSAGHGASSTVVYGAVSMNAKGGGGCYGNMTPGTADSLGDYGISEYPTGGQLHGQGGHGQYSIRMAGPQARSGFGGASHWSCGGGSYATPDPVVGDEHAGDAGAPGAGGSGAVTTSVADQNGGAGGDGRAIVWEYA